MKKQIRIEYDESLLSGLGLTEEEFQRKALFWIASHYYTRGRLPVEMAADFCGVKPAEFLDLLAQGEASPSDNAAGGPDSTVLPA